MTEEQREKVIDKAARAMCSVAWAHAYPDEQEQFRKDAKAALEAAGHFKAMDVVEAARHAMDYLNSFDRQPCPLLERERRCHPATPIHCATIGRPLAELDGALEMFAKEDAK